ncbi:MAG: hypothetical protein IJG85_00180 [Eubacteriaceae bacterium]|nr:hypothetical protein [Eubacteriaceae bacterium]
MTSKQSKGIFHTDLFYVDHLNPDDAMDLQAIDAFIIDKPEGRGLQDYFKYVACDDEKRNIMRTYLVRYRQTDACVGYFSLKAGLISMNESVDFVLNEKTGRSEEIRSFDTLPGVEMANFAVNSAFVASYPRLKGLGQIIFSEFVIPIVKQSAEQIGIKLIYIFALPEENLIHRYETYGFQRMSPALEADFHRRLKPRYDENCIFMYQAFA